MNRRLVVWSIGIAAALAHSFAIGATAVHFLPLSFALICSSETSGSSRLLIKGPNTSQTCIDGRTRTDAVRIQQVAVVRDRNLNGIYEVVVHCDSNDAAHVLSRISAPPPELLAVIAGNKVISIVGATKSLQKATIWLGGYSSPQAASSVASALIQAR